MSSHSEMGLGKWGLKKDAKQKGDGSHMQLPPCAFIPPSFSLHQDRILMFEHLFAEFASTALMIVFGVGVHCDETLKGSKYRGSGHMFAITTWSFGISVCLFI
ncbi:hypothetical protein [Collinsella tanakaei]|uniref:hypothetical protein n=1 Tax=Collinsella tanakaei TaxID=626935 RepID=UPI002658DBF5|nr:hypothetical protein [Collinsella tanakaei]